MIEQIFYFLLGINLFFLLLLLWGNYRTHLKLYRKWKGGTWYLYVDSYLEDTETGVRTNQYVRWTQRNIPKNLILKTESYEH